MRNGLSGSRVVAVSGLAILVSTLHAQNVDDMVRWTSAEVVHYDVVADYTGTPPVLVPMKGAPVTAYPTQLKDRYEVGFDWNPAEMVMVGKPVFKNFPSTLPAGTPARSSFNAQACPQPRMTGSYDHVEVIAAKTGMLGSNSLELTARRTYPAGAIPYATEVPGCTNWADAPAKVDTVTEALFVPPGMYLAMPAAAAAGMTIGKDGKTMNFQDKLGWAYVYTLSIVK
jgi:hypothetical protein